MPYVKFGLKVLFARFKWRSSASLMLIKGRANNFNLPYVFNNDLVAFKVKIGGEIQTFPINKQEKPVLNFLGLNLYIRDIEDASNDLGLVYVNRDDPYDWKMHKRPDFIPPEQHEIILNTAKLTSNIKSFFDKYQNLLYLVIGLCIGVAFNLYVSWELLQFVNTAGAVIV